LEERLNAYSILAGKRDGKEPLGCPICRWVDNIKIDLREIEWRDMDWIDLAQDRGSMEGSCEYGNEPSCSINCWEFLE
jgi:hypothetical protein